MRPVASDYDGDSNRLTIDWMRLSPYAWTSTYLSAVFDAAAVTNWNPAAWTGTAPAGTTVELAVRAGNSSVPDASWSAFTVVNGAMNVNAHCLQCGVRLTTKVGQAPAVNDVTLGLER